MLSYPNMPRIKKAGLVLLDPSTGNVERIIALQYNPGTLTRTLAMKGASDGGDRSEALRLNGPPAETIKFEAEIDAADHLEFPDENELIANHGIFPHLAALESLIYPSSTTYQANNDLAAAGSLEIVPMESLLLLFVWSKNRVQPVRITEFTATEEAFDHNLNPLRARVSMALRVLTAYDLGFSHRGGTIHMAFHQNLEQFASLIPSGTLEDLGLTEIP